MNIREPRPLARPVFKRERETQRLPEAVTDRAG